MVSSRVPCVPLTRDTDAMLARTVHFLPSAAQAAVLRPAAVETSKAIESLGAGIRRHRRPTAEACADARRTTRLPLREGGFGSTLSSLIKPYLWSLLQARVPLSAQPLPQVHGWLAGLIGSDLFASVMLRLPPWQPGDAPTVFATG